MIKLLFSVLLMISSAQALASDRFAGMLRPGQLGIAIVQEEGGPKLPALMKALMPGRDQFEWQAPTGDATISCTRTPPDSCYCQLRFVHSENVTVGMNFLQADLPLEENLPTAEVFDIQFLHPNGHRLVLQKTSSALKAFMIQGGE